ncbi:LOG family protein [Phlyctochytrium arcticum]|nr:LOG family protein [Phlyctochytrium arcticum]
MPELKSICVYCGSSLGKDPVYENAARELGSALVKEGISLVYGGGSKGLMGVIANSVHLAGGKVLGIMPETMSQFEGMAVVGEVIVVHDMHTRKQKMNEHSSAFIAMPGGFGTFEELFEIITWLQLNIHSKPIGILNVAGFYDPLVTMIDKAIDSEFIRESNRGLIVVRSEVGELIQAMKEYEIPEGAQYNLSWEAAKDLA